MRNGSPLFDGLRDGITELIELGSPLFVCRRYRLEQGAVLYDQQGLAQGGVRFGGNGLCARLPVGPLPREQPAVAARFGGGVGRGGIEITTTSPGSLPLLPIRET